MGNLAPQAGDKAAPMTYPLVHVTWEDACSIDPWTKLSEFDQEPTTCETVGFLVKEDPRYIVVCSSLHTDSGCCCMVIPRGMIVKSSPLSMPNLPIGLQDDE